MVSAGRAPRILTVSPRGKRSVKGRFVGSDSRSVYARRKSRRELNSDYLAVTIFTELTWILTLSVSSPAVKLSTPDSSLTANQHVPQGPYNNSSFPPKHSPSADMGCVLCAVRTDSKLWVSAAVLSSAPLYPTGYPQDGS